MNPEDLMPSTQTRYSKSQVTTFLDKFSRNDPSINIFSTAQSIAEADIITVCIQYFLSRSSTHCRLTHFLQIVMLLQYTDNYPTACDYREQIKLYELLDGYQYSFADFLCLFQNGNKLSQIFYTDAITATQECLTFLVKQSKKIHKSWILFLLNNNLSSSEDIFRKPATSTPPADLDQKINLLPKKQKEYIFALIDMHNYHKRFNNDICATMHKNLKKISNEEYSRGEINLSLIKFIINCPFFKSASYKKFNIRKNIDPNKQKQLWGYIATIINKSRDIVLKEQVLDYIYAYLFVNPTNKNSSKLQLLKFLNKNLSITDKSYITRKLTLQRSRINETMLQAIFDLNFGLHGKNHFNSQCNDFLRHYLRSYMKNAAVDFSAETINNMWCNYTVSNRALLKLLCCTNFANPELDLSEYMIQEIYQWIHDLQKYEKSPIQYIEDHHTNKFELNPSAAERILRTTCAMLQTNWLATNDILRFKVTLQVKLDDILVDIGEVYWSLTFKDNQYCWYNPEQFQGEIRFDWYQIPQVANNFYKSLNIGLATNFTLHQYTVLNIEPIPKPLITSLTRKKLQTSYSELNNNRTELRLARSNPATKLR